MVLLVRRLSPDFDSASSAAMNMLGHGLRVHVQRFLLDTQLGEKLPCPNRGDCPILSRIPTHFLMTVVEKNISSMLFSSIFDNARL